MAEFWNWLASSAGTILLAILAGAGGSALLELFWKPRRDRRRAAALLISDIANNTELLLLQTHVRQKYPKQIPADFYLSTIGWNAASQLVSELPPKTLRKVVLLFNCYESINRDVAMFEKVLAEYQAAPGGSAQKSQAETMILGVIDVFNTTIDRSIDIGKELIPGLANLAGIRETTEEKSKVADYAALAEQVMSGRQERIAMFKQRGAAPKP